MGLETLIWIIFLVAVGCFLVVVVLVVIEDFEQQKMEDICWNHGFSDLVFYNDDFSSLGNPFCCDTNERNCKPLEGVEKHKWYGQFCDFIFECDELRGKNR